MLTRVKLNQNFSAENKTEVPVVLDGNASMLKTALEDKYGKDNVTVETVDGEKKLIVHDGDKVSEFSLSEDDASDANKNLENRNAAATPSTPAEGNIQDMSEDEAREESEDLRSELEEVESELSEQLESDDPDEARIQELKSRRDEIEGELTNFSRVFGGAIHQTNFSAEQLNFSQGEFLFSAEGKNYYFQESTEDSVGFSDDNGEYYSMPQEDFSNYVTELAESVQEQLAQFNFSSEQGNFTCIDQDENNLYFSDDEGNVYESPVDSDEDGKLEIDPAKFYVVCNKTGTDGVTLCKVGTDFVTKEAAEAEAKAITPESDEVISAMSGSDLINMYQNQFESFSDSDQIPVTVEGLNKVSIKDLEVGDEVRTPYGDNGKLLEPIKEGDTEVKVYIPADDQVVEVPVSDFKANFSVVTSIKDYINFSAEASKDPEAKKPEDAEVKPEDKKPEDKPKELTEDEKAVEAAKAAEAQKTKDDNAKKDESQKPATVAEVKAIAVNEIDKQKDAIVQQAAQETVAAIAPALQSQAAPADANQAPASEGAAPNGPEAKEPKEPEAPKVSDESTGEMVNHSRLLNYGRKDQSTNPTKLSEGSYAASLTSCYRRGRQSI